MSYLLPHLHTGWHVDQAILSEEDRVVIIRFGRDGDETCMRQDEILSNVAEKIKNFAVTYLVDIDEVPDFNEMYELYDPCTCMFFFRNKHIMIDLGTGNNNKINWAVFGIIAGEQDRINTENLSQIVCIDIYGQMGQKNV